MKKARLKTTFDNYGRCITGHIEDTEIYEGVKSGKLTWKNGLYQQLTHIRIPKEVFERLMELDRKVEKTLKPITEKIREMDINKGEK